MILIIDYLVDSLNKSNPLEVLPVLCQSNGCVTLAVLDMDIYKEFIG